MTIVKKRGFRMSLNKYETYKKAVEELVGSYDSTLLEAVKDIGNIVDSYA